MVVEGNTSSTFGMFGFVLEVLESKPEGQEDLEDVVDSLLKVVGRGYKLGNPLGINELLLGLNSIADEGMGDDSVSRILGILVLDGIADSSSLTPAAAGILKYEIVSLLIGLVEYPF
jgi:hypothetical protein